MVKTPSKKRKILIGNPDDVSTLDDAMEVINKLMQPQLQEAYAKQAEYAAVGIRVDIHHDIDTVNKTYQLRLVPNMEDVAKHNARIAKGKDESKHD